LSTHALHIVTAFVYPVFEVAVA